MFSFLLCRNSYLTFRARSCSQVTRSHVPRTYYISLINFSQPSSTTRASQTATATAAAAARLASAARRAQRLSSASLAATPTERSTPLSCRTHTRRRGHCRRCTRSAKSAVLRAAWGERLGLGGRRGVRATRRRSCSRTGRSCRASCVAHASSGRAPPSLRHRDRASSALGWRSSSVRASKRCTYAAASQ